MNKYLKKTLIILFWIAIWAVIAFTLGSQFIFAGPNDVLLSFCNSVLNIDFWLIIAFSLLRIFIGSIISAAIGFVLALLSYKSKNFKDFIDPLMQFLKSAPIVCFIVLLLIIFGVDLVDVITVIISSMPIFFYTIYEALKNRNTNIANMLKIYKVPKKTVFSVFEWPSILPYVKSAVESGIGVAWKAGVTAQLIGAVSKSIGAEIYNAKLYLASDQLIMWMIIVIILSFICEKLLITIINLITGSLKKNIIVDKNPDANLDTPTNKTKTIVKLNNLCVTYDDKTVIKNFNLDLYPGDKIAFCDKTGSGKTTIINIIMGLLAPSSGSVNATTNISAVFQENTLLDNLNIADNISVVTQKKCDDTTLVEKKLYPKKLSGGTKRLAQIERAIQYDSKLIILDEPFAGLDNQSKQDAINYINNCLNIQSCNAHYKNRAMILISHEKSDAEKLGCNIKTIS